MKAIIILCSVLTLFACCASKKAEINNSETGSMDKVSVINGTVRLTTEGCKVYIDAKENKKSLKMYPVNLADDFKVDGMKINFSYNLSRAPQPMDCVVDKVVSVENVTKR